MKKSFKKNFSGFTLIELSVTVTIIGILSSIAITGLSSTMQKAQDTSYLSNLRDLQLALEAYKSVNGKYPAIGTSPSEYILGLLPDFISKLPNGPSGSGFEYSVSSDKKSYCVHVKGIVYKPESQPNLKCANQDKTWVVCKGKDFSGLTTCSGVVGS